MIIASSPGVKNVLGDSVVSVIPVDNFPQALLFNPSNTNVYVGNVVSNSVSILDSENNTVAGTVDINSLPLALEFNPSNKAVYVAGTLTGVDGLISVIE